jgi:hypothetical protein
MVFWVLAPQCYRAWPHRRLVSVFVFLWKPHILHTDPCFSYVSGISPLCILFSCSRHSFALFPSYRNKIYCYSNNFFSNCTCVELSIWSRLQEITWARVPQSVWCRTVDWMTRVQSLAMGKNFCQASAYRLAQDFTQPPVQWVPGARVKHGQGVMVTVTTHSHLVSRSRMKRWFKFFQQITRNISHYPNLAASDINISDVRYMMHIKTESYVNLDWNILPVTEGPAFHHGSRQRTLHNSELQT